MFFLELSLHIVVDLHKQQKILNIYQTPSISSSLGYVLVIHRWDVIFNLGKICWGWVKQLRCFFFFLNDDKILVLWQRLIQGYHRNSEEEQLTQVLLRLWEGTVGNEGRRKAGLDPPWNGTGWKKEKQYKLRAGSKKHDDLQFFPRAWASWHGAFYL